MKLLFINAHPDDVEFTCASTCKQAVDLGWDVTQLLMTTDEYGTKRDDFKGERIRKIRKHEMEEAAKVYGLNLDGTTKLKLIWFGEIDGHLPFNRDVYLRLKRIIIDIAPNIIIGPDSFFSYDLHPDHKHTGWLVYLIVKSIEPPKRPLLLLYHSCNTNFFIPFTDYSIQLSAWAKHVSQTTPLSNKILSPLRKLFYNVRRRKTGSVKAEGFRKAYFTKGENQIRKLRHKIVYLVVYKLFSNFDRYTPTPKDLGIIP